MGSLKRALLITLLVTALNNKCSAKELVTYEHKVLPGETLDLIAQQYITPDRYFPEFREGIVENNYETIFAERDEVRAGDILKINRWES
jgi:hypothetical protein